MYMTYNNNYYTHTCTIRKEEIKKYKLWDFHNISVYVIENTPDIIV